MAYDKMLDPKYVESLADIGQEVVCWYNGFVTDEPINGGDCVEFISMLVKESGIWEPKEQTQGEKP